MLYKICETMKEKHKKAQISLKHCSLQHSTNCIIRLLSWDKYEKWSLPGSIVVVVDASSAWINLLLRPMQITINIKMPLNGKLINIFNSFFLLYYLPSFIHFVAFSAISSTWMQNISSIYANYYLLSVYGLVQVIVRKKKKWTFLIF